MSSAATVPLTVSPMSATLAAVSVGSWGLSKPAARSRWAVMSNSATAAACFASPTSCRNRHCPKCQGLARAQWLADRQSELLPVPYFHIVFTVPASIAEIALHNKAVVYDLLFKTAIETLRTIATDPKHL